MLREYAGELKGIGWDEADLCGAVLAGANLQRADLSRNNLGSACVVNGADLRDADLSGALLQGVEWDDETRFPAGFSPDDHGTVKSHRLGNR